MKNAIVFSLLILFPLLFAACAYDAVNADYATQADCSQIDSTQNTYAASIKAILDANCATAGCHDVATQASSIDLSTFSLAKEAFTNGEALCSIHFGSGCIGMPKAGKLSDELINKIDCWVKNGFLQ